MEKAAIEKQASEAWGKIEKKVKKIQAEDFRFEIDTIEYYGNLLDKEEGEVVTITIFMGNGNSFSIGGLSHSKDLKIIDIDKGVPSNFIEETISAFSKNAETLEIIKNESKGFLDLFLK